MTRRRIGEVWTYEVGGWNFVVLVECIVDCILRTRLSRVQKEIRESLVPDGTLELNSLLDQLLEMIYYTHTEVSGLDKQVDSFSKQISSRYTAAATALKEAHSANPLLIRLERVHWMNDHAPLRKRGAPAKVRPLVKTEQKDGAQEPTGSGLSKKRKTK